MMKAMTLAIGNGVFVVVYCIVTVLLKRIEEFVENLGFALIHHIIRAVIMSGVVRFYSS